MSNPANYPDILGLITGGARCNIGVAQVALAVRPRLVRAGRPFEVITLVQNAADTALDVSLTLHLPAVDAHKQPDRFISKSQRLVVEVKGAEVGYVMQTVTSLSDTAISDGYKIGVEIDVKPLAKPARIRAAEGGGAVEPAYLDAKTLETIESLKTLSFSTAKRLGRSIVEVPLTVMSGMVGHMVDFTPGWVSVCKLSDYHDNRYALHRYGATIQINTLPKLKRSLLFAPLLEATQNRFAAAGFALETAEAAAVAKLMVLVLEYATPRFNAHGNIAARGFDVEALLLRDPFSFEEQPAFPHWLRGLISTMEIDERAASHPAQVFTRYLYDDLLRDAVDLVFDLVAEATGEDMGSVEEQNTYREQLIDLLTKKNGLDFSRVYLPLVMGGVLINDQLAIGKENPAELLRDIGIALEERFPQLSDEERALYTMTNSIIARAGQRYGFYLGG